MKLSESSDSLPWCRFPAGVFCAVPLQGLAREEGRIVESNQWNIGIFFPEDYFAAVDVSQVLMYLGRRSQNRGL